MRFFHSKNSSEPQNNAHEFSLEHDAIERIDNDFPYEDEFYEEEIKPKHRLRKIIIILIILCVVVMLINVTVLFFTGKIWFNEPDKRDYPIRGALIDSDMGEIQWDLFSKQNISAAYIRATNGTSFVDKCFKENWKASGKCDLVTGAYHIFSLNIDGESQAEYFCNAMGKSVKGRLIPAVEVDLYGLYGIFPADKTRTVNQLQRFCDYVQDVCGVKPLIMCKQRCYEKYIKGGFDDYPLWIKDVYSEPDESADWDFWCYNNRVRLKGYKNSDEFFSMFVYKDIVDIEEFKQMYVI